MGQLIQYFHCHDLNIKYARQLHTHYVDQWAVHKLFDSISTRAKLPARLVLTFARKDFKRVPPYSLEGRKYANYVLYFQIYLHVSVCVILVNAD